MWKPKFYGAFVLHAIDATDALVDFHTGEYLRAGWPIFIEEDLRPSSLV